MARIIRPFADERLAEHLALGKTVAAAAKAAGISERSAYRRKKQPAVRDRIAEVRRAALDTASSQLHQGMVVACDRLIGLLGHANPHVQIRAAQTVIQLTLKVRQEVDVADQLDRLAEPTRPSSVLSDTGAPSAGPDSARDRTDQAGPPRTPEPSTPDGAAGPPPGIEPSPAGIELATGGDDRGPGVWLDPPPTPGHPGGTPGLDPFRSNRTARLMAMVSVLLVLAGLPCAFAGETPARVERGPAADGGLPACQNLTEPATMPRPAGQNRLGGQNPGRGGALVGRVESASPDDAGASPARPDLRPRASTEHRLPEPDTACHPAPARIGNLPGPSRTGHGADEDTRPTWIDLGVSIRSRPAGSQLID